MKGNVNTRTKDKPYMEQESPRKVKISKTEQYFKNNFCKDMHSEIELKPTCTGRERNSTNDKRNHVRKEPCSLNKDLIPSNVRFYLLLCDSDIPSF